MDLQELPSQLNKLRKSSPRSQWLLWLSSSDPVCKWEKVNNTAAPFWPVLCKIYLNPRKGFSDWEEQDSLIGWNKNHGKPETATSIQTVKHRGGSTRPQGCFSTTAAAGLVSVQAGLLLLELAFNEYCLHTSKTNIYSLLISPIGTQRKVIFLYDQEQFVRTPKLRE